MWNGKRTVSVCWPGHSLKQGGIHTLSLITFRAVHGHLLLVFVRRARHACPGLYQLSPHVSLSYTRPCYLHAVSQYARNRTFMHSDSLLNYFSIKLVKLALNWLYRLTEDMLMNNYYFCHNFATSITDWICRKITAWGPNGPHVSTDC